MSSGFKLFHENLRLESQEPLQQQLDKATRGILKMEKLLREIKADNKALHANLVYIKNHPGDGTYQANDSLDILEKSEEKLEKCLRMRTIKAAQRKRYYEYNEGNSYQAFNDEERSYFNADAKRLAERLKRPVAKRAKRGRK